MQTVYLDNNATTQPAPEVVAGMMPFLTEMYGNPSSVHRMGQRARQAVDEARMQIATLVGCSDSELLFTGGGTEAINTAIRGILLSRAPRKKIVISTVEHSATRELCQQLGKDGCEIVEVGVERDGSIRLMDLMRSLDDNTALVSIMWANNETGAVWPVEGIAQLCAEQKIPFHCDATQMVGKLPVDFKKVGFDAASFASHKFHGPKGVGALYTRKGLRFKPFLIGGPQERGRRGGTENVPGIVGMGVAAELAQRAFSKTSDIENLRDDLENRILKTIPETYVNAAYGMRLPNTTNIAFSQLEAEAILLLLSEQGVCASAGAACSSGSLEPSHVLRAMRIDEKLAHGSIRFSLSRYTTQQEIDRTLEVLPPIIKKLRAVLPLG